MVGPFLIILYRPYIIQTNQLKIDESKDRYHGWSSKRTITFLLNMDTMDEFLKDIHLPRQHGYHE